MIETKFGEIEIKFFPDEAPGHVENFIELANKGVYNGTLFHRIIPGFMIQGGDPNTTGADTRTYGQGGPGYEIQSEFNAISHKRGIVSMARGKGVDSAGSQFFIMVDNKPQLDGQYTVFGEVVRGMDVVDLISELPRNAKEMPLERVSMKVKIIAPPKAPVKK
ncbi:peptidylprolyl isomerase [bacterium]|nr:MAG: peptidylprolyl isomerase [bacterium]